MKKVFLIERTDGVDYDEYDSCVIIADSLEEVEEILSTRELPSGKRLDYWDNGLRTVKEIDLSKCESMELLASFNA